MNKYVRIGFISSSLIASGYLFWALSKELYHPLFIFLWIFALILYLLTFIDNKSFFEKIGLKLSTLKDFKKILFIIGISIIPLIVRVLFILHYGSDHLHRDEFITGIISSKLDLFSTNFFNPQPQDLALWVAQFPSIFFYLQQLFFKIFGVGFLQLKLSNIGYLMMSTFFLYTLSVKLFKNKLTAISIILVHSFLACSLYFDTLSTMFTASASVYLLFLVVLYMYLQKPNVIRASSLGIVTGLNYLFYISSYIALPMGLLSLFLLILKTRKLKVLLHISVLLLGFVLVILPFTANMLHVGFYPAKRVMELNFTKYPTISSENIDKSKDIKVQFLQKSIEQTIRSLAIDDFGGAESYSFGNKRLLENLSLLMISIGFLVFFTLGIFHGQLLKLVICLSMVFSIVSVIISNPPPGIHRMTLAFPLFALLAGVILNLFFKRKYITKSLGIILLIIILLLNVVHIDQVMKKETINPILEQKDVKVIKRILELKSKGLNVKNIVVAAYPGFAIQTLYYFFDPKTPIFTDYHLQMAEQLDIKKLPYFYIVLWPQDYLHLFNEKDPIGKSEVIVKDAYAIFYREK